MLLPRFIRSHLVQICMIGLISLVAILFFQASEVQAMFGLFKRFDVEMSPPVSGRIRENGQPVAGLQIARSLSYEGYKNGKEILEHTMTNDDGEFSFPELFIKSKLPGDIFGQNMMVSQSVYITQNKKNYFLWLNDKPWNKLPPLSQLLLNLKCDLLNKEVQHLIDTSEFGGMVRHSVESICHWKGDLISTYYNNELISSYDEID